MFKNIRLAQAVITSIVGIMLLTVVPKYSFAENEIFDINNTDQVKKYVDDYFGKHLQEFNVPGAAFTIVKDGHTLFSEGYGFADLETKTRVDPDDTVFRIGSVTKNFTATAIMQLYEQGKIDLKADINQYLRGFTIHGKNNKPITIDNLLTHTSGFDEYYEDISGKIEPIQKFMETHIPKTINEPGVETLYSNYGYALLGYIIETVSGETYDQYMQKHILNPLGMKTATLHKNENDHIANSYAYDSAKKTYTKQPYQNTDNYAAAGNLSMKIPDMGPYMMAHLKSGSFHNALLGDTTTDVMQASHFKHDPSLSGFGYGLWEDVPRKHRAIMHGGTVDGFRSWMYLVPEEKLGFAIFTNSTNGHALNQAFFEDFNKHFYPIAPIENQAKLTLSETDMKSYTGTYQYTRYFHHGVGKFATQISPLPTWVVEVSGPGELKVTNGPRVQTFVAEKENTFVEKNGTDRVYYYKTPNGATHFTMSSYPMDSFEIQPSNAGTLLMGLILVGLVLVNTLFLIIAAIIGIARKGGKAETKGIRRLTLLANVIYIITLPLAFSYFSNLFGEAPTSWKISLYTALLAFLLFIISAVMWIRLLKLKNVNALVKMGYAIVTLTGLILTPYLMYWNIVGKFF